MSQSSILRRLALGAVVFAAAGGARAQDMPDGDWWTIDRDLAGTRYSPLTGIDRDNVGDLVESWRFDLGGNSTAVPLAVDGVVYVPAGDRVVALNGASGEIVWSSSAPAGGRGPPRVSTRGVGYWPGDADRAPRILFTSGARIIALDAADGTPAEGFGVDGSITVDPSFGGVPTINANVAIIGASVGEIPQGPPGNPRAYDVVTGEQLWEFETVPRPGDPYNDTWGDGWENRSGTNMWAFAATVDAERGIAYLPIAGPAANYYGGDRPGDNLFANSIVAVDALTGEYRWHFQTVHHDLWDVDMPNAGTLFDFTVDGETRPAIAYVGKSAYLFVLDRVTGEPLIEIEERPVPAGDVPGEYYSPTQPFPVRPPPLSRVSFDAETDLVHAEDTSREHAAACRQLMERAGGFYNEGPFTPFLYKGGPDDPPRSAIQFPGGTGGVNWGGGALDPSRSLIIVNAHDGPLTGWVEDKDPDLNYGRGTQGSDQPYDRASISGSGPYSGFTAPIGGYDDTGEGIGPPLPCFRPPWAELVAVDASRGEIVWRQVLGLNENLPEGRQRVGGSGSAGPTVTAGGLVFVGATNDRRFRAFDTVTGEELWAALLGGTGNANPMSYADGDGRQHVAIVAGGELVVYGLR
ncbi:MAG TPA: PQQ-binding-like beta-propeller repeat protein [Gammaproteobacteria bacterium]|nr:PQQ-binding-like beta-propeller repeat protein [Gammaproteobacteria bacterium]